MTSLKHLLEPPPLSRQADATGTRVLRFAAYRDAGAYGAWTCVESEQEAMLLACTDNPPLIVEVRQGLDRVEKAIKGARVLVACLPEGSSEPSYWEARMMGSTRRDDNGFVYAKVRWLFASTDEYVHIKRCWHAPEHVSFDACNIRPRKGYRNPLY